ncbi:uncharacterized protein BJ212DRAFT_1479689 [Suillus subaureus]|uniref:Uncharacterized protein n=1 Tax=Suillus subaureus TaxID=48587 RepID=A0A9P7JF26_9AGAM|nr:uncharacterized protein BJ212DRAFT_1479689 [Suillus subaureus]KAG1818703.1 hypothetical protein BJ212DRAFT_1479689 [Suillus subaureus]
MTQKTSADLQKSPPPEYVPAEPHMADREQGFPEEQVGGGRCQLTPVIETLTKLQTHIKATNCDGGLVKEASIIPSHSHEPPHEPPQLNLFATPAFVQEEYNFCGIDFSVLDGNVDGDPIAGPSTMLPAVPHTQIIPPMPTVGDWDMPHPEFIPTDLDFGSNMAIDMDDQGDIPTVKGQRQGAANALLQEGFMRLKTVIHEVSCNTSIPTHQVIALWHKSNGCSFNNVNHWNAYSSYFKANPQQELKRLGNKAPKAPGTPSAIMHHNCYELFKNEYPDSWQTILEYHEEATVLMGAPQTVAMQAQEFHKFGKKVSAMMDITAAHFGFEGALVTCGKVVNQDGSLSLAHTMPGAAGFWLMHCKANDDTIIGHLKAQVYNLTSLGVVDEAFKDEAEIVQCNQSEAPIIKETTKECLDISKNGILWIKQELGQQIEKLGSKLSSKRNFPWKTLPAELIRLGMIIRGYPEDVLLPGNFHTTSNKGITNLTLKETGILIMALKAGLMQVKKVSKAMQAKLLTSKMPVLEGAPPTEDCTHRGGRHLFANGQSDRLGLPHAKPSAAATRMKKVPMKSHKSPIILSDDNNSDNDSSVQPILKPPPSCEFKVVRLPKSQKKVKKDKKNIIKKIVKKEVISLVSSEVSNAHSGSEKPEDDNKAKKTTLQASKKRVSPAEPPLLKAGNLKSMKGKGKACAEKSKQPSTVESSDDEEAPNVIARAIEQPSKCLHDGPKVQEVPKASVVPNDAEGTTRGSEEAPISTEPVAVAGHVDSELNDADGTARGSAEALTSTEPAATAGHANSVPTRPLPPLSPSQIHQQVPSLPENYIQTKPATHVVASNTLHTDPVCADPTTCTASQDNTMHTDPIHSDHLPSLQPDLTPMLASNHGHSKPAMEISHDQEASLSTPSLTITMILMLCTTLHNFLMALSLVLISISPLMACLINPLMALNLSITMAGIMMLHTMTLKMDMMDVNSYWHPPSSAYFGPGGRYQHGYEREYPNKYPEDLEDGGRAP